MGAAAGEDVEGTRVAPDADAAASAGVGVCGDGGSGTDDDEGNDNGAEGADDVAMVEGAGVLPELAHDE